MYSAQNAENCCLCRKVRVKQRVFVGHHDRYHTKGAFHHYCKPLNKDHIQILAIAAMSAETPSSTAGILLIAEHTITVLVFWQLLIKTNLTTSLLGLRQDTS